MPTKGGKPYSLSLSDKQRQYKWHGLIILPHFILWGRITEKEIAHLAITDRKIDIYNVVWENRLVPYRSELDVAGHVEAKSILEKFERLWPCHFLAKEYLHEEGI